jgi:hypothetical protein
MNPPTFANWLRHLGHRVIKTESSYWYNAQPGFCFYFPYHRLITPSRAELSHLFLKEKCLGVRYFSPLHCYGKSSYLIVCSNKNYDITSVDAATARRQTRRGMENFEIRQIDFASLASQGMQANHDTLLRQGRDPGIWNEKKWREYCSAAQSLDGFEAWGAFREHQLAAFIIGFKMEDYFTILHHSSMTEYLRFYPNNALVFYLTELKLNSMDVNHVSYGPESLDAPDSLDEFKFRMGFEKLPIKQNIAFNPIIKPFVNGFSHKLVQTISSANPKSDIWRKLSGVIRFYMESD